jgi:sulfur relay (sulfurtransferase) DsrF/TusC family protein
MEDIDLHHAYDQTERWVKEMSLRRFGVPEEALGYLAEFDRHNRNLVLTAFGPGKSF